MKLLIITQSVDQNNPVLGFFHRWIEEFSKHCEFITVICLERGKFNLPENVKVLSLGKETGKSKLKYLTNFYKYLWQERKNYDAVFVHMNQIYAVLGSLLWKLLRKRTSLWYVHRQISFSLWLAEKFVDIIFTATPESFRLPSRRVITVGHGVDTEKYSCARTRHLGVFEPIRLLHVGRITKIKHCEVIIKALGRLRGELSLDCRLRFVGAPVSKQDHEYFKDLQSIIARLGLGDNIEFVGNVIPENVPREYCVADITLNLAPTGGLDKVVLESIAAGRVVFTANTAFRGVFGAHAPLFIVSLDNPDDLANKIRSFLETPGQEQITNDLLQRVRVDYDFKKLVASLVNNIR